MWNRSHSRKKLVGPIPTPKNFLGPIPPHKKTFWDLFQLLKKIVGLFPPLNFTIGTISTFTKFQWDLFHSSFFLLGLSPQPPLSHPTSGVGRESRDRKFPGISLIQANWQRKNVFTDFREGKSVNNLEEFFLFFFLRPCWPKMALSDILVLNWVK